MPKRNTWFTLIVALALLLVCLVPRLYHLGSAPPGLHIDEVSFAADAKAIAETGRDTWNTPWPTTFKAFGEWKAPGLTYSMAFWTKLLGRMDTSIARLPSAIAGLAMLVALFGILRKLLGKVGTVVSLTAVLLLAFSPWQFDMSRIFYESLSANTFLALALLTAVHATLGQKSQRAKWLYVSALCIGFSGYWYASVRYTGIALISVATLMQSFPWRQKIRVGCIAVGIVCLVGIAWLPDLFSQRGLTRLSFYQEKSAMGSALDINEKRQYCYLSFGKDQQKAKICYVFWNKPLFTVINGAKTYLTYLSPEFLFMSSGAEYGFDGYYGTYLLPLAPLYLIGLIQICLGMSRYFSALFRRKQKPSPADAVDTLLGSTVLISLFPAAMSNEVTPRMGVLFLFIVAIMLGLGLSRSVEWVRAHLPRYALPLSLIYGLICLFFIAQSLLHYFAVFTHSNDWQWTSDAGTVFSYVKEVSPKYDRIIDTTLHGPLAPYFYGDITTKEMQTGIHSEPNADGWSFLIKAGKYELIQRNIQDLACEKWGTHDARKTLVITQKVAELSDLRQFVAYTGNGIEVMHEVYDLDKVVAFELDHNTSFTGTCTAK